MSKSLEPGFYRSRLPERIPDDSGNEMICYRIVWSNGELFNDVCPRKIKVLENKKDYGISKSWMDKESMVPAGPEYIKSFLAKTIEDYAKKRDLPLLKIFGLKEEISIWKKRVSESLQSTETGKDFGPGFYQGRNPFSVYGEIALHNIFWTDGTLYPKNSLTSEKITAIELIRLSKPEEKWVWKKDIIPAKPEQICGVQDDILLYYTSQIEVLRLEANAFDKMLSWWEEEAMKSIIKLH